MVGEAGRFGCEATAALARNRWLALGPNGTGPGMGLEPNWDGAVVFALHVGPHVVWKAGW